MATIDGDVLALTPTLDTNIYADGDVLFDTVAISNAAAPSVEFMQVVSVNVLDEDDQGAAFDLVFLDALVSLGTVNAAVSVADANARSILGRIPIASGDYYDMGGCRIATVRLSGPLALKVAAGATTLYVAGVSRGTGTYTASGLKLKIGIIAGGVS